MKNQQSNSRDCLFDQYFEAYEQELRKGLSFIGESSA
jgi:hypothetical protein